MNDCLRGRGGPCGGSEVWPGTCRGVSHTPPLRPGGQEKARAHTVKRPCKPCVIISYTMKRLCRCCIVVSHTATGLCRWYMILSHTATTLCRCCIVVSHTATRLRRCCMVVSHTATGHAMGRMRPYLGTRHSCTRPNSQASADALTNLTDAPDARRRLHLRAFHSKYSQR